MVGGNGGDRPAAEDRGLSDVERGVGRAAGALGGDVLAACGADEGGAAREHVRQRPGVEMIEMRVAREYDVDEGEEGGIDGDVGDALVRRVGTGVLLRQRVGEVRVDEEVLAHDLHEEAALPEPPDVHPCLVDGRPDLGDQIVACEERLDPLGWLLVEEVLLGEVRLRRRRRRVGHGQRLGGPAAEGGEEPSACRRALGEERVGIV